MGSPSFSVDGPKIWIEEQDNVHGATSIDLFRKKFKTDLFAKAYPQ